jgi:hypothetical protein
LPEGIIDHHAGEMRAPWPNHGVCIGSVNRFALFHKSCHVGFMEKETLFWKGKKAHQAAKDLRAGEVRQGTWVSTGEKDSRRPIHHRKAGYLLLTPPTGRFTMPRIPGKRGIWAKDS